jgi:hypothetical protein
MDYPLNKPELTISKILNQSLLPQVGPKKDPNLLAKKVIDWIRNIAPTYPL